ncbi:MAG TPA: hypothetical protein PKX56_08190 [Marmoricola sp.]|nr:hypothetical protein [Marmoricola sp.]
MKKFRWLILLVSIVLVVTGFSGPSFAGGQVSTSSVVSIQAGSETGVTHVVKRKKRRHKRHHKARHPRHHNGPIWGHGSMRTLGGQ